MRQKISPPPFVNRPFPRAAAEMRAQRCTCDSRKALQSQLAPLRVHLHGGPEQNTIARLAARARRSLAERLALAMYSNTTDNANTDYDTYLSIYVYIYIYIYRYSYIYTHTYVSQVLKPPAPPPMGLEHVRAAEGAYVLPPGMNKVELDENPTVWQDWAHETVRMSRRRVSGPTLRGAGMAMPPPPPPPDGIDARRAIAGTMGHRPDVVISDGRTYRFSICCVVCVHAHAASTCI